MLPYLVAGLIGAGAAMATKDKKKGRKKYAKGGQLSYDEKRNLLTDATIKEAESYGLKAYFQDMSLFAQEAGKDAPIGFFQDACNFAEWAERSGVVTTPEVTEEDIEEAINEEWTELDCRRDLEAYVTEKVTKKVQDMELEEFEDFYEDEYEEAKEDGVEDEYISNLRKEEIEEEVDNVLSDICMLAGDDVDNAVYHVEYHLDEKMTITQFNEKFDIVDVDTLMEKDDDECDERAEAICEEEDWDCHQISYGPFMIF